MSAQGAMKIKNAIRFDFKIVIMIICSVMRKAIV